MCRQISPRRKVWVSIIIFKNFLYMIYLVGSYNDIMKDRDLIIFTLIGMSFTIPFLITIIINPSSFGNNDKWALIFLGMATASLPIAVYGAFKILYRLNEIQYLPEDMK